VFVTVQVNVLYLLPAWLGSLTSHPLIKTHPDRSCLTLIVYGTPHVPFKYKRRTRTAGFRDLIYGDELQLSPTGSMEVSTSESRKTFRWRDGTNPLPGLIPVTALETSVPAQLTDGSRTSLLWFLNVDTQLWADPGIH